MEQKQETVDPAEERLALNEENVRLLWSKTYNTDGKPDWSHIFAYYHRITSYNVCYTKLLRDVP